MNRRAFLKLVLVTVAGCTLPAPPVKAAKDALLFVINTDIGPHAMVCDHRTDCDMARLYAERSMTVTGYRVLNATGAVLAESTPDQRWCLLAGDAFQINFRRRKEPT